MFSLAREISQGIVSPSVYDMKQREECITPTISVCWCGSGGRRREVYTTRDTRGGQGLASPTVARELASLGDVPEVLLLSAVYHSAVRTEQVFRTQSFRELTIQVSLIYGFCPRVV